MRGFGGLGARVVLSKFWSFDCAKASAVIDKMICGSEVLRIFDTEIARAFGALLARQGLSVKDEQRLWLQTRNRSCGISNGIEMADCLAQVMRTHERYLHYRLMEESGPAAAGK